MFKPATGYVTDWAEFSNNSPLCFIGSLLALTLVTLIITEVSLANEIDTTSTHTPINTGGIPESIAVAIPESIPEVLTESIPEGITNLLILAGLLAIWPLFLFCYKGQRPGLLIHMQRVCVFINGRVHMGIVDLRDLSGSNLTSLYSNINLWRAVINIDNTPVFALIDPNISNSLEELQNFFDHQIILIQLSGNIITA